LIFSPVIQKNQGEAINGVKELTKFDERSVRNES
jgi:hypothetical protein